jgi:AMMECR1 domain-containing protein
MQLEQEELATLKIKVDVLTAATKIWSKKLQKTPHWQASR